MQKIIHWVVAVTLGILGFVSLLSLVYAVQFSSTPSSASNPLFSINAKQHGVIKRVQMIMGGPSNKMGDDSMSNEDSQDSDLNENLPSDQNNESIYDDMDSEDYNSGENTDNPNDQSLYDNSNIDSSSDNVDMD